MERIEINTPNQEDNVHERQHKGTGGMRGNLANLCFKEKSLSRNEK